VIFYLLAALIAAVTTAGLSWLIWKLSAKYRLYPTIRERDVHSPPTPRLGGVAMFLGIVVAFAVASQVSWFHLVFANPAQIAAILGAAFIIVLIGVADDIWDLDWLTKLTGQIIAAGLLVWQGVQLVTVPIGVNSGGSQSSLGITVVPPVLGLALTVIAVVLVMNAVNFIDGLDGLVAGVAILANGVFFIYSYWLARAAGEAEYFNLASLITAVLIGACAGFLPLNWHPAKLFMGDSGALLVGLLMATSAISVTGFIDPISLQSGKFLVPALIPILLPFAILLLPIADFVLAVTRRIRAGKSPFSADRKHLHHRLLDMGHTHLQAVLIFYSWTAVVAVGVLSFLFVPWGWSLAFIAAGLAITTVLTLAPLGRQLRSRMRPAAPSKESPS
jgi:UDP-GlcNAc:undecaprenyl-phosphate GlcNAc-1-phosphate transferase